MTDIKSNESRRKLLKSIAAGSGAIVAGKSLPESWSKPVVDSVMLPAHAQTSDPCGALTITQILYLTNTIQCGDTVDRRTVSFSLNVSPVPPPGTTVSLSACFTASPVPVDGSGNAQMDINFDDNVCTNNADHTLVFSIGCGSTVSCVLHFLT